MHGISFKQIVMFKHSQYNTQELANTCTSSSQPTLQYKLPKDAKLQQLYFEPWNMLRCKADSKEVDIGMGKIIKY